MTLKSSLYPSIVKLCIFTFIFPYTVTFPLPPETYYEISIASLRSKQCIMPSTVELPFAQTSEPNRKTFDFLSAPLKECQTAEAIKDDEEAHLLCKEIFEVLQNITCTNYNITLPNIKSNRISGDVCDEFKAMKDVLPTQNQYLSVKLADKLICKLLCGKNFTMLCQTLLWSYDIQEQIGNFLRDEPIELKNPNAEEDSEDATEPEQQPLLDEKTNKNEDQSFDNGNDDLRTEDKKVANDVTNNNNLNKPSDSKNLVPSSISSANPELTSQISPKNSLITAVSSNTENKELPTDLNNVKNPEPLPTGQSNSVPGGKVQLIETDNNENRIPEHEKSPDVSQPKHENPVSKDNSKETAKVLVPESVTTSKAAVPNLETVLEVAKNTAISKTSAKKNETTGVPAPLKPSDKKEINNLDFKEEREPETQENLPKPEIPDINKISEAPKGDVSKNLYTELTTVEMSPEEEPEDKDEEQFFNNDTENEGDLEKSEFEETDELPNKATADKNSKSEGTSLQDIPKSDDTMVLDRNHFGRDQEEVMNVFPEQEDGHFFFYLLSIVLILMAGYLVFHNKQKILALIVEGRHERRRRSHGSGYKKLETK